MRPQHFIWKHFKKSQERKNNKQHYIASCNYCQHAFDGQPLRMIKHLLSCNNAPNELKILLKNKTKDFDNVHRKNKQKVMEGFIDKCSIKEKEELDNYLSLAIFGSGLPLSIVENHDGWTNNHNESIINFMVTLPKPLFWKALETKESSHTAEYISEKIEEVISEVGQDK
ncbi:15722_t:CDS:2, partial [Entrophospora sp. SA101]